MPQKTYQITSPDGRSFQVTAPEGATQEQVLAYARENMNKAQTIEPGSPEAARMTHASPAQQEGGGFHPVNAALSMIRGDASENLPSVYSNQFAQEAGWSTPTTVGGTLTSIAGSDENVADYIKRTVPGASFVQDANGNPVVQLPDGRRFYLNQPGLDTSDILRGIGKAAAFAPAAALAGKAATIGGKFLLGGLASGATDAAMQAGASTAATGSPRINPTQSVVASGLGGAAELTPAVGSAVGRAFGRGLATDAKAAAQGARIADEASIPTEGLSNADLIQLGRRFPEIQGGASPDAALAESEFGFNLTRGQKTGDVGQLRREEMLRSSGTGSTAGRAANQIEDAQRQNLENQASRIQDYLAGKNAGTPAEATDEAISGVQRQAQDLKSRIDAAYNDVRAQRANVDISAVKSLPETLKQSVRDFDLGVTPTTEKTLQSITQSIDNIPKNAKGVTMRAIEATRKKILNSIGASASPADKAAMMKVKNAFDGWIDDAFDNALISGDREALDKLKQARALRHEYAQRFEPTKPGDRAGKLVQRMIDVDATPDELAGALFGSSQIAPRAAVSMVRKLRKALGPETDAWNAVRAATVRKALTNRADEVAGPQAIVSNLSRLFKERPALMNTMYSPQERALMQRFAKAVSVLIPPGSLAKSSGTGERLFSYFTELLNGVPFGGAALNVLRAPGRAATASRMMAPVAKEAPRWIAPTLSGASNVAAQNGLLGILDGNDRRDNAAQK